MPEILIVCTANVCRSPGAAAILASRLAEAGDPSWRVRSAGVRASEGSPACDLMLSTLDPALRGPVAAHRSHLLDKESVERADLILTAEVSHRGAVARLDPRASHRAFTLAEAARLLPQVPPLTNPLHPVAPSYWLDDLVQRMHELRPTVSSVATIPGSGRFRLRWHAESVSPLDIADGHGLGRREHLRATRATIQAAEVVARHLTGLPSLTS